MVYHWGVTACLLHNEPASYFYAAWLSPITDEATGKPSLNWAYMVVWSRPETE